MPTHRRPSGRPVHPECPKLDSGAEYCQCDELWDYWDGTDASLHHHIISNQRKEYRTRQPEEYRLIEDEMLPENLDDPDDLTGFWKDSEQLISVRKSREDK